MFGQEEQPTKSSHALSIINIAPTLKMIKYYWKIIPKSCSIWFKKLLQLLVLNKCKLDSRYTKLLFFSFPRARARVGGGGMNDITCFGILPSSPFAFD